MGIIVLVIIFIIITMVLRSVFCCRTRVIMVSQDTCISGSVFVNELSIENIQGFL